MEPRKLDHILIGVVIETPTFIFIPFSATFFFSLSLSLSSFFSFSFFIDRDMTPSSLVKEFQLHADPQQTMLITKYRSLKTGLTVMHVDIDSKITPPWAPWVCVIHIFNPSSTE